MKKSKPKFIKREPESPEIIKRRWDFKKEQIEILANNIQKLRYNVTLGLKDSDNEKVFLTALVVAIILETSERVGNEASASNDRVGITGLKKKQVSIDGNKVTLEYTGKSGVEHVKSFSDEKIAKALKLAIKRSKTEDVFCTSDGFKIKADRILRYLSDFSVRSKDLRSIGCNKLMIDRLKNEEVPEDENKRKKFFMQSLRKVAIKIGHGSGTLRKHYLIPELETNYIKNGNIIDIRERDSYEDGGEIKETFNDGGNLSKTPAPKKDKIYGSKINKPESAESKDKASSITLSPNVIKSIVNIIHKHNEEYPEKKINTSTAKAVVRRGMGAYSSTHRPTISEGKPNSRVAWGLARLNAFVYKIQNGKSKSGKYNQDDDLIDELGYKVKSYSKGGSVNIGKEFSLTFYRVSAETDSDSKELYFGNNYNSAKLEYDSANVSDFTSDNGGLVMFQKYTNKYKFVYESDEEFESIEDYPIEDYYNDSDYYKLIEEGEYEDIENRDVKSVNKESDDLLMDVENHYKKVYGNYKYNKISINNEKDEYDDDYKEYGCIQLRIADHSENVKNIDKFGSCDYYISVVIANKNKTANKFLTSMYERRSNEIELSFDSDDSFQDIISEIDEKIKEGKEYILDKNGVEAFEKGGTLSNIEFKCNYEKYFEYVPLSEIEKYIEFDREVEHKISKKYLDELTEEIKVNGITYPITLEIDGYKGIIVEGNHRIAVAKRLGIKYIPVRVVLRSRPFKGTIYENKVKELPSRPNMEWAKVKYGVSFLDSENSAAVNGFTKVEPKFENGGSIELLAPNGKKSNLTLEQYNLVRTENFKKWFGDWENDPENSSKVVDSNGEPLIVYHSSPYDFNVFEGRKAYYFSVDKSYSEFLVNKVKGRPIKNTYSLFLNCRTLIKAKFEIETNDVAFYVNSNEYMKKKPDGLYGEDALIDNESNKFNRKTFVVFSSNNIKLSDGSNDEFDSKNPDIRFEKGGELNGKIDCPNCSGSGEIKLYEHIEGGKCFTCGGKGYVYKHKLEESIDRKKQRIEKKKQEAELYKIKSEEDWNERYKIAKEFNQKIIDIRVSNASLDMLLKNKDFDFGLKMAKHQNINNANDFLNILKDYTKFLSLIVGNNELAYSFEKYMREKYNYAYLKPSTEIYYFSNLSKEEEVIFDEYYKIYKSIGRNYENGGQILTSINGNKSNLTKSQYELVKSPEFIKFFGNWEVLAKAKLLGDNIKGFYKKIFKGNEEQFLFEMAMQANNSESEKSGAIDVAGEELIELALELYPNVKLGDKFKPVVSKVVDSNNEPLVCYHGTINGGFNIFDSKRFPSVGYFAEDINFSKNFIRVKKKYGAEVKNEMIYNVFLSIKNPVDLSSIEDGYADMPMEDFVKHLPFKLDSNDIWVNQVKKIELPVVVHLANKDIINSFKRHGYDGVKFNEGTVSILNQHKDDDDEMVDSTASWVSFYPEQIKLSDGSNYTFDSNNPDIRFDKGGEVIINDNFKKWFSGSKVVDEFGKPKIVFHGTSRKFNVFDSKEIGQGTGNFGHYGYGFYFSDDIIEAKGYGNIILECYLNIEKPFTGTDEEFDLLKEAGFSGIANKVPLTIDFNDLHEKMKLIDSNSYEFMSIAKEKGIDNVWSIYLESHPHPHNHKIDLNDIYDILGYTDLFNQNNAVSDYAIEELNSFGIEPKLNYGYQYSQSLHWVTDLGNNSQVFTEFIKSLDYDGVIYGSEYIAFYPNQIKLANGINTTFDYENPDIRFEHGGELIESNDFKAWFGKSKIVDIYGNPLVLYHGTSNYFSVFDENKRDIGFHFGNLDAAKQRGEDKIIMSVYLKMENPLRLYSDLGQWDDMEMLEEYLGESNYEIFTDSEFKKFENVNDVRLAIQKKGCDGIIYENAYEKSDENDNLSYIVFSPNQIKIIDTKSEKITFDNFYKGTNADFKEIMKSGVPKRKPDFVSDSGSKYWFTTNSVIRQSDHWGQLDTCEWNLDGRSGYKMTQGICNINDFKK